MQNTKDRISIQVGLSGYSFKIEADDASRSSGWLGAERIFTTSELQKRYDDVEIAVFTPKCTLIPMQFHHPLHARRMLSEVVAISDEDPVEFKEVPEYAAVLLYSNAIGETLSKMILASYMDGHLYLVIAQGKSLLLCNSFQAQDFTTAEYFIFLAMKKLQLNPEVSTICFRTALSDEEEMSLYRYFKNVEQL